jgi:hypothetical protein
MPLSADFAGQVGTLSFTLAVAVKARDCGQRVGRAEEGGVTAPLGAVTVGNVQVNAIVRFNDTVEWVNTPN